METLHPYQYDQLTEPGALRLIVLQPDHDLTAPVRCSLISTTLQACHDDLVEKYTALSYVWGDAKERKEILVDGTRLDITASLDLALRHVRDPVKVIRVWADGICINQQDVLERNKQVAQMGLIYEIANHTIIFLGLATEQSDILIRAVNSVGLLSKEMDREISLDYNQLNKAFIDILNYPWFTRVWTLQELVLSADPWIQCGSLRCRWGVFGKYIPWRKTSAMEDGMQSLRDLNGFRASHLHEKYNPSAYETHTVEKDAEALLSILHSRRGLGATDPRDFIYAHLGMISKKIQKAISIDYEKSCSSTYTEIARQALVWIPSLDILQMVGTRNESRLLDGLPSWVPDWSQSIKRVQPGTFIIGLQSSPRTRPKLNYCLLHGDSTLLLVPVKSLGTVEYIFPAASERAGCSTDQVHEKKDATSQISNSSTSIPREDDAKFKETMLDFFGTMLESIWGEERKDIVMKATSEHNQYLNDTQIGMLRGVVTNILKIRDKSLPLYRAEPWESEENGTKNAYELCKALLRITELYLWVVPARVALLSTKSLICISEDASVGDLCCIDLSAGLSYGDRSTTTIFVRRDEEFSMSDQDRAALPPLRSPLLDANGRERLSWLEDPGVFRFLARGEFEVVSSELLKHNGTGRDWSPPWKEEENKQSWTGLVLLS
ncbi:heterokaryon incompatibility protein-domain-containing protein [Leptodontidium sp. MPI-SDFR-AT-0119]|nr:heterokaryon incompatibility protein-domain-containing protein [Leptodontidium sp. MPI-SDFR-AT-0119]